MRQLSKLGDLSGRIALITGGAGHLGRAMAEAMMQSGCIVILADRSQDQLDDACASFSRLNRKRAHCVTCDLESEAARIILASRINEEYGRLDILINNAGFVGDNALQGWVTPFAEQSIETWRRALEVNLTAPFHLAQLFASLLQQSGNGTIINISSIYGILGPDMSLYDGTTMGNPAGYAASKGGLVQLTRWLATTLAPHVRVNTVSPGGIGRGQPKSFVDQYVERTPLKRMGKEEDFLGVIAFLASDLSAWVTGQNIVVDGGWSTW
ncbi:MAG: SDR family oxidoreductase [Sphingorhabdus sp.]